MIQEVIDNFQTFRQLRHDLHHHPELSYEEHRTAKIVAHKLREYGLDEIVEGLASTGVIGVLRNGEGPSIGLRADMDALPIIEKTPHSYRSRKPGVMHACGHDGHTVILLAAAKYLAKTRNFRGSIVFIFQPAEEYITGAPSLIQEGLLQRFPFDSVYTLHSWPGAPTNQFFVNTGAVMASVNNFQIKLKSPGGHAAMPHTTSDTILAGAHIVQSLQNIIAREIDAQQAAIISTTVFQGGQAHNIIPSEALLKGTVRYIQPELGSLLIEKMQHIAESIARVHNVSAEFDYKQLCPATYNNKKEALFARKVIQTITNDKQNGKEKAVSMGSDDFCFYLEEVPGAYVYIGNGEDSAGLHNPEYDFNDEAIITGASFYIKLVEMNQEKL